MAWTTLIILVKADKIVGSGVIWAPGGKCEECWEICYSGGGGRVSLISDEISDTLETYVHGGDGGRDPGCDNDNPKGKSGTINKQCKLTACRNGGSFSDRPDCACACVGPWGGRDCSECQEKICRSFDGPTTCPDDSAYACLPGLEERLGWGFDIFKGEKIMMSVLQLHYSRKKTFTHRLLEKTFLIPDNVLCKEITVDKTEYSSASKRFTTTDKFQIELAAAVGIPKSKIKKSFFAGGAEFRLVYRKFKEERTFLQVKTQYHPLYECTIQKDLSPLTQESWNALAAPNPVEKVGTHVIERASFGGFIELEAYIDSCVLKSLTGTKLEAEINKGFFKLQAGVTYSSSSGLTEEQARFTKKIGGGDKTKFIGGDVTNSTRHNDWVDTLLTSPTVLKSRVLELQELVPHIAGVAEKYISELVLQDEEVATNASTCPTSSPTSSPASSGVLIGMPTLLGVVAFLFVFLLF